MYLVKEIVVAKLIVLGYPRLASEQYGGYGMQIGLILSLYLGFFKEFRQELWVARVLGNECSVGWYGPWMKTNCNWPILWDYDHNDVTNLRDFAGFANSLYHTDHELLLQILRGFVPCMTGPEGGVVSQCDRYDKDGDGDVDLRDWAYF